MTTRPFRRNLAPEVVRPEEFNERFSALTLKLDQLAVETLGDDFAESSELRSALLDDAHNELRSHLEDEIIPAHSQEQGAQIAETEAEHEQIKRALAHLKLQVLRDIARERRVEPSGTLDHLTARIASALEWDGEAIARLILDHTDDPPDVTSGHLTRVFTIEEDSDLTDANTRLSYVKGRYIRTGIARWFIFKDARWEGDSLRVDGSVNSYRALAREVGGSAFLDATPSSADVSLELEAESGILLVHGASLQDARASLVALATSTSLNVKDHVARADLSAQVAKQSIHSVSSFMLDLVYSRLQGNFFRDRNPILARFRFSRSDSKEKTGSRLPSLNAVRFDGEHLLDSREACSLLWVEGRPLVDLTVRVAARDESGNSMGVFNVRITVENDHVSVATSFGSAPANASLAVHRATVASVRAALVGSQPDWDRLRVVEDHVERVATSDAAPESAELLRDPGDI